MLAPGGPASRQFAPPDGAGTSSGAPSTPGAGVGAAVAARPDLFERVGRPIGNALAAVGDLSIFGARALFEMWRPPYEVRETLRQIYELGFRSVPLIAASGLAVGVVLSMHTRATLERFGAESMIPAGLAIALVRETGPLTAGLLLSGRIGAGIGAELAAMKVTEQIDALEATAVDSFKYLVVTRVAACMLSLPLLVTIMNFTGMAGGLIAEGLISGMSPSLYFQHAFSAVQFHDYLPATLKTIVFGFIIGTMSSYLGVTTTQGTEGVGRASTRSVVFSSILIITSNVLLVRIIFFLFPEAAG
jgi:phospholipid/cholesterol/gamma-HCH transport system permease protein